VLFANRGAGTRVSKTLQHVVRSFVHAFPSWSRRLTSYSNISISPTDMLTIAIMRPTMP
jgi:hypothetical protein